MEFSKGKDFFAKKFEFLQKTGLKGIDKVLGEQSNLIPNATTANQVNTASSVSNINATNEVENKDPNVGAVEGENVPQEGTAGTPEGNEIKENFDDDLLWSNQYTYDAFIDSLNTQYEERGTNMQEKRHWSYPRRWSVKLFNLKIVNLLSESLSCFAEFDFGGTRDECRVQIGSSNYILSRGKSKNYIRTPVLKDIEKDQTRSFQCSHSFEYRGSYLDLENEKLRIKLWSCKKYTVNSLVSIYDQFLIKFAEGDEHIEIPMYKYIDNQKKLTCNLSFNLFFQELYDFEINLINFKINNAISTYFLFNYLQLHLSKLSDTENSNTVSNREGTNNYVNEWNLLDKMRYSIFRTKMERKMKKIKANKKKEKEKEQQEEDSSDDDFDEDDQEDNQESGDSTTNVEPPTTDPQSTQPTQSPQQSQKTSKKKKRKKKSKAGVGYKSTDEDKEKKDKETTLTFQSDNNEYITILRDNIKFFVQVGKYVPFVCEIEPWPRLFIRLKTDSMHLKNMSLLSHSVKNAFSCEWDNLGEIVFRGTLNELCNSHLEIKLMDWSAPKAANCIGVATIPMESIVDYPYISSRLYPPEWLKLKSQYEGWNDKLDDLQLGTVTGTMIVNRKPRYRQLRGTNRPSSSSHLLIVHINNIDQLLANTQESVDSYVEVTFNNVTLRTNLCKDMLGPKYNEELYIPIPPVTTYEELVEMGSIKITVWGYIMEKLNYFGSCEVTVGEVYYNKNVLRPLTKKMHNLMDSFKYEVTYETIVFTTSKKLYHYQYNEQDHISNISFSAWFYPLITPSRSSEIGRLSNLNPNFRPDNVNPNSVRPNSVRVSNTVRAGNSGDWEKLIEIWKNICMISNNENFAELYYFYDQFGNKMFPSSFVHPIHSPPAVDSVNHMFHFVNSIPFVNKKLQNVFTIDFLLKLKTGSIIDHCVLFLSFLINYNPNFDVYAAIGQQKDKKFNAFLIQFLKSRPDGSTNGGTDGSTEGVTHTVNTINGVEQKNKFDVMVMYDFNMKHGKKIHMEREVMKREVKKSNFQTINILFNDKNLWLNVQSRKDIASLDYDINNINNWYPFIPYNPTMHITKDYYHKIITQINQHINSHSGVNTAVNPRVCDTGERMVYYINWHRKNEYVVNIIENRMLEELKRYISMYRSAQNLVTNFNACQKLQEFLKRYIIMVHARDTNHEDNLEIIKSQISEWRSQLENKIPRGYRILIRTVRFNTIDSGNMFDVIKHKLDFLDSRESTSIFVVALKIFEMCSDLFSTYFLIMHANKIDETLRNIILLQTHVEDKVRSRAPEDSEEAQKNKTLEELAFESNVADVLYDPEGTGKADEDRLQRIRSLKSRFNSSKSRFTSSKSRFSSFKSTLEFASGSGSLVLSENSSTEYITMSSRQSEFYENLKDEEVLKMDSYDFTEKSSHRHEKSKHRDEKSDHRDEKIKYRDEKPKSGRRPDSSKYRDEYSSNYTFSSMKTYTTSSLQEALSSGTLVSGFSSSSLSGSSGSRLDTNVLSSSTYTNRLDSGDTLDLGDRMDSRSSLNRTLTSSTILKKILTDSDLTNDFESHKTINVNLYLKKILTNSSITTETNKDKIKDTNIKDTKIGDTKIGDTKNENTKSDVSDSSSEIFSSLSSMDDTMSSSVRVVNKKLPLNSKIIKNKKSNNSLSELDRFSNLNTLKLSTLSTGNAVLHRNDNIFPSPTNIDQTSSSTSKSINSSVIESSAITDSSSLFTSDLFPSSRSAEKSVSQSIGRSSSNRSQGLGMGSGRVTTPSLTKSLSSSNKLSTSGKLTGSDRISSISGKTESIFQSDHKSLVNSTHSRPSSSSRPSSKLSSRTGVSVVNRVENSLSSGNINSIIRSSSATSYTPNNSVNNSANNSANESVSSSSGFEEPTHRKPSMRSESITSVTSTITSSSFTSNNNLDNFKIIKNSSDTIGQHTIKHGHTSINGSGSISIEQSEATGDTDSSSIRTIIADEESTSDFSTTSSGTGISSSTLTSRYSNTFLSSKHTINMTNSLTHTYTNNSTIQPDDSSALLDGSSEQLEGSSVQLDDSSVQVESTSKEEDTVTGSNEYVESWSSLNENSESSSYRSYRRINPYSNFLT